LEKQASFFVKELAINIVMPRIILLIFFTDWNYGTKSTTSCEVMIDGRSLKKSRGRSMLSCGTPEITGRKLDS